MRAPLIEEGTRVIGFIRPDHTRRVAWIMLGGIPTLIGALLIGYSYGRIDVADPVGLYRDARMASENPIAEPAGWGSEEAGTAFALFGLGMLLVASGPIGAIWTLRRLWRDDEWVLLRDDALVVQAHEGDTLIPWYEVERIRCRDGEVMLELRDGGEFQLPKRFAGRDADDTAKRLDTLRRKCNWGLNSRSALSNAGF